MKETINKKTYEGCEMHFRQPFDSDQNQYRLFSVSGKVPDSVGGLVIAYSILGKDQIEALKTAGVKVIIDNQREPC